MRKAALFLSLLGAFAIAGCDSGPSASAPAQPKQNQLATGRFALQKLLPSGRLWAPDSQPFRLESSVTSDSNGHDGKAMNWRAEFGSPSLQKAITYTWTGQADAERKIDHGHEDSFSPSNHSTQTFDLAFLKSDTDEAFKVAQEHGGKALTEKDPKQPVIYLLDFDPQAHQLRWHVIYGDSENSAKLTVLVNASSGDYLRKE
jgi:hypothetical protein